MVKVSVRHWVAADTATPPPGLGDKTPARSSPTEAVNVFGPDMTNVLKSNLTWKKCLNRGAEGMYLVIYLANAGAGLANCRSTGSSVNVGIGHLKVGAVVRCFSITTNGN